MTTLKPNKRTNVGRHRKCTTRLNYANGVQPRLNLRRSGNLQFGAIGAPPQRPRGIGKNVGRTRTKGLHARYHDVPHDHANDRRNKASTFPRPHPRGLRDRRRFARTRNVRVRRPFQLPIVKSPMRPRALRGPHTRSTSPLLLGRVKERHCRPPSNVRSVMARKGRRNFRLASRTVNEATTCFSHANKCPPSSNHRFPQHLPFQCPDPPTLPRWAHRRSSVIQRLQPPPIRRWDHNPPTPYGGRSLRGWCHASYQPTIPFSQAKQRLPK